MRRQNKQVKRLCAAGLLMAGAAGMVGAQDAGWQPVHELDPYPVEAERDLTDPYRGELHDAGRLLLDPLSFARSGTWIGLEELQADGASRIEDLFWRIPGAAAQARFGVITVPTIRGDAAGTLFNGQRRGDNLFGLPLSFTAVESVEVVAGPAPLSSGTGKRTGGSVNLTSLRAFTGMEFGRAELRLGSWLPGGGSYTTLEGRVDLNVPLTGRSALRVAAGWRGNETFYDENGGRDDARDLYFSWLCKGKGGARLEVIGLFHEVDRPQTLGVNRPWQGLIDDGLYVTGRPDPKIGLSDPPGLLDPGIADPGLLTSGPGALMNLPRDRVLMSRGDVGKGSAALGQLLWEQPLGGGLRFSHGFMAERVFREKLNQFYYAEDVEQFTFDSQSRFNGAFSNRLGWFEWETGLHVRVEERDNRTNYWNEYAYAHDISEGRRFAAYAEFPDAIVPGAVTGSGDRQWYVPTSLFGTPETTESRVRQLGLYGEAGQELGSGWRMELGLRADWLRVEASEPEDLVPVDRLSDEAFVRFLSGFASLVRDWERAHLYLTAGLYRGIAGNTVGDGVNLYAPDGLHREDFLNRSRLLEAGGSWNARDDLRLRWAVFDQKRRRTEFFGSNDITARGVELELDWRPAGTTRLTLNARFLDAAYDNAAPAEFGGGSLWNVYAPGAGPTGQGNGLGYTRGFFLNSVAPGDHELPGLSRWQVNAGAEKAIGDHWDIRVWGGWASSQRGNLAGEYEIPDQMEWNASLGYRVGRWEARVFAYNLLDAGNWIHNGDTFFDQLLISRNLPLRLEARLRWRF